MVLLYQNHYSTLNAYEIRTTNAIHEFQDKTQLLAPQHRRHSVPEQREKSCYVFLFLGSEEAGRACNDLDLLGCAAKVSYGTVGAEFFTKERQAFRHRRIRRVLGG